MEDTPHLLPQMLYTFIACYLGCWTVNTVQSTSSSYGLGYIITALVTALVPVFTLILATALPALLGRSSKCDRRQNASKRHITNLEEHGEHPGNMPRLPETLTNQDQDDKTQLSITEYLTPAAAGLDITHTPAIAKGEEDPKIEIDPANEDDEAAIIEIVADTTEQSRVQIDHVVELNEQDPSIRKRRNRRRNKRSKVIDTCLLAFGD